MKKNANTNVQFLFNSIYLDTYVDYSFNGIKLHTCNTRRIKIDAFQVGLMNIKSKISLLRFGTQVYYMVDYYTWQFT